MHRIASALLITVAVLALNTGLLREAFAAETPRIEAPPPVSHAANARLVSLLVVLEVLRQQPLAAGAQKV